jgi:hypothetical protein
VAGCTEWSGLLTLLAGMAGTAGRVWLGQLAGSGWGSWQGVAGTAGREWLQ